MTIENPDGSKFEVALVTETKNAAAADDDVSFANRLPTQCEGGIERAVTTHADAVSFVQLMAKVIRSRKKKPKERVLNQCWLVCVAFFRACRSTT